MNNSTTIRQAALNYLARREHSYGELLLKLSKKKFAEDEIRPVLDTLTQEGLLSHTRFIENYIHYRREKGYGPVRIRAELLEKGLQEEFIEDHLQITDNTWREYARQVRQKRFKSTLPRDFKTRAVQMRFLYYRGFTQEQIEFVFSSLE